MRVLVTVTPSGDERFDDATVQATRTAKELRTLGVEVDVSTALAPDLSEFDLVHLFAIGPVEPTLRHALRTRAAGLPMVLTLFCCHQREDESLGQADRDNLRLRETAMRRIPFGLADALAPSSQAELDAISSEFSTIHRRVTIVPVGHDEKVAESDSELFADRPGEDVVGRLTWKRAAEATLAVYNAVMDERGSDSREGDWRATFTPDQYIEHLESLIQLQLETIALRDGHYASAVEYAQSLEADRERREEYIQSLEYAQNLEVERARLEAELETPRSTGGRMRRRIFRR